MTRDTDPRTPAPSWTTRPPDWADFIDLDPPRDDVLAAVELRADVLLDYRHARERVRAQHGRRALLGFRLMHDSGEPVRATVTGGVVRNAKLACGSTARAQLTGDEIRVKLADLEAELTVSLTHVTGEHQRTGAAVAIPTLDGLARVDGDGRARPLEDTGFRSPGVGVSARPSLPV